MDIDTDTEVKTDPGVGTLIGGIVADARKLLIQQATLFKIELKKDFSRTTAALVPLFGGMLVLAIAFMLLAFAAAYGISWLIPEVPLWGGFAAMGVLAALAGAVLLIWAKSELDSALSLDNSVEGLKENLQWKTNK
jgi:Putative Actinobacterial Holin-X, holin superfamily III